MNSTSVGSDMAGSSGGASIGEGAIWRGAGWAGIFLPMRLPEARPEDPDWTAVRKHDVEELWDFSIAPHVAASYGARIDLLVGLIERFCPAGARVLDVGCAQGTLGLMLAERGFDVSLLD